MSMLNVSTLGLGLGLGLGREGRHLHVCEERHRVVPAAALDVRRHEHAEREHVGFHARARHLAEHVRRLAVPPALIQRLKSCESLRFGTARQKMILE
jgi:hypothetical protein